MDTPQQPDILSQIISCSEKFSAFNSKKIELLNASLGSQEAIDLFNWIPFLLHVNLPEFPGYESSSEIPTGINNYSPSNSTMNFIRTRHPSASIPQGEKGKSFIQMFALMGSGGTIAFNSQSDFDFWICADTHDYSREAMRLFRHKCRAIEDYYAENFNMEVHFFLNDITNLKNNIFDDDAEDNLAGTSLGYLLKEEFLRSSILISGKTPFWWVVPVNCNDETYDLWLKEAESSPQGATFIDIGNLYTVNRNDFLIAALFQILKALGNPFKSLIKLGLLERYLADMDKNPYISNQIKQEIHNGNLEPEKIDAYVVMFNHVYDYYNRMINDITATNIIKTCFYLKINPMLSEHETPEQPKDEPEKIRIMRAVTRNWGWDEGTIKRIDSFDNWDIEDATKLSNNMKKYLLKGYKRIISGLGSEKAFVSIHQDTMKGIYRKIYSHFSPEKKKIDNTLSMKVFQPQKLLSLEFVKDKSGREFWILGKKTITESNTYRTILYKSDDLISLIVWTSLIGIYRKNYTRLNISAGYYSVDLAFIQELLEDLNINFSIKKIQIQNSFYLQDPFPLTSYIILNLYSRHTEKIDNIFFLYHNSWGETRFEEFGSENDLAHIVAYILNSGIRTGEEFKNIVRVVATQPCASSKEHRRLKMVLSDIYAFFVDDGPYRKKRYLTMLGNSFYVFSNKLVNDNTVVGYKACETELKLLYSIAYNRGVPIEMKVDETVPELNYLRKIFDNFSRDSIQIYFQRETKYSYYFVSDEQGSLVFYRKQSDSHADYLGRLYTFARGAVESVIKNNPGSSLATPDKKIKLYQLMRDVRNNCTITEINPEMEETIFKTRKFIVPSRLSIHLLESGDVGYRFTLPDGGYTDIFDRSQIVDLARELRVLMDSVKGYHYYISDINLQHAEVNMYKNFTSFSFSEKNRFELMVEKGLQKYS